MGILGILNRHEGLRIFLSASGVVVAGVSGWQFASLERSASMAQLGGQIVEIDARTPPDSDPQHEISLYKIKLSMQLEAPAKVADSSTFLIRANPEVVTVKIYRWNYRPSSEPELIGSVSNPLATPTPEKTPIGIEAQNVARAVLSGAAEFRLNLAGCVVEPATAMPLEEEGRLSWSVRCSSAGEYSGVVSVAQSSGDRAPQGRFKSFGPIELEGTTEPVHLMVTSPTKKQLLSGVLFFLGSFATLPGLVSAYRWWREYRQERRRRKREEEQSRIILPPGGRSQGSSPSKRATPPGGWRRR